MNETPETRLSLLRRLSDSSDTDAWREFAELYEPLVYRVARRRGLQDADAREVTQDVLVTVARAIARWQPTKDKGAFRSWLFRVTRNLTINLLVKQQRQVRGTGDVDVMRMLEDIPDPAAGDSATFDEEFRRQLFRTAAERVRQEIHDKTWQAFWRTCIAGETIQQVATTLDLTVGSVYAARSRVTAKLNAEVRRMEFDE